MSLELPQRDDYQQIFLVDTPMLDVRAPIEYEQGTFPATKNLPIMNNDERHRIGVCYKKNGQDSAIALGHQLVSGDVKARRIQAWIDFIQRNPGGALYCFRGGMRSKITQRWIYEQSGVIYPRVSGGYKAMRTYLLNELGRSVDQMNFLVLSGRTGVGKTKVLHQFKQHIDLEGIFQHNGSAFGRRVMEQPSQASVENALSICLMKHRSQQCKNILIEDESANIGSRRIPNHLLRKMTASPVLVLESSLVERQSLIYQQYVIDARKAYQSAYGVARGTQEWANNLQESLLKIRRRLGGERYKKAQTLMTAALKKTHETSEDEHKAWIYFLLTEYYDAMYDYQLEKKSSRVVFRGNKQALDDYLCHLGIT